MRKCCVLRVDHHPCPLIQCLMAAARAESQESSPKKLHSAFGGCRHCAIFLHSVFGRDVVLKEKAFWILLGQGIPFPCILSLWKCISIWTSHRGKISTKPILWSKCLSKSPLPDKCQSEFGWECSTQILQCCLMNPCLCARRSGSSSSALLCMYSPCQVRHSCHSDLTPKASPILRQLLTVRVVRPCSHSSPFSSIEYHTKFNNIKLQVQSKLSGDDLCCCHGPELISDGEKGLLSEAEGDDYLLKTRRGGTGESNSRKKWNEIKGRNMSMQKMDPWKCARSI